MAIDSTWARSVPDEISDEDAVWARRFAPEDAPEAHNLLAHNREETLNVVFDWTE